MYGLALALLSAVLFGASTPASKLLLASLGPLTLAGLLYLGAALGVLPVVLAERRRGAHATGEPRARAKGEPQARAVFDRANARRLAGAVLFGGVLGPVLLLSGLRLAGAGSVSLLLNLELAATAALGALLFREPLAGRGWLGVGGVVVAGALLSAGGGWPGLAAALLVAAACACWGLDNHWTALIDGISPARATLAKGAVAGATNLALGASLEPFAAGTAPVAAALAVGAASYGASIALYVAAAHELGATRAQSVFASAPFVGAALAFAALGEPFGPRELGATALLAGSLVLLLSGRHAHRHVHEPLEHVHSHRHDDSHHLHQHPGLDPATRHTHAHRHERLVHAHPHWPDLHHRHGHRRKPE